MDLEARLKEDYLEASSILGGSTSASLDKHLKRKLSDRYLDFTNNVKGATEKLQTAIRNIQAYLAKRGDYPLASAPPSKPSISPIEPTLAQPLSLSANTLNIQLDLSETSSACPTKMGEGRDGPSHSPLPKVVVRSEEEALKLNPKQKNLDRKPNIRVPLKPKASTEASRVFTPQELQIAYQELLVTFSDPLTSAAESRLLEELMERHEENEVQQSAASHMELFICVQTLMDYDEYKYDLIHDDQVFVRSCEAFDSRLEPTLSQDIFAALIMHPSSGDSGMVLFDEAVYSFFISDYEEQEEYEQKVQEAIRVAVEHLHCISDYNITPPKVTNTINYTNTNNQLINTRNLDIWSIRSRICDIALAIKSGCTTLAQNYSTLKTLIESAVIIMLEQGYTYDEIPSLISVTIVVFLDITGSTAYHIQEVVSGLMPRNLPNLLNLLRQPRSQFQLRSLLR